MASIVAAARNDAYCRASITRAIQVVLDHLDPPLPTLVKRGDRALLKVNMGCRGCRDPSLRYTSHPLYVEAIIHALHDCGARVTFGDDVSRTARYARIWRTTGMWDVAERTGASLTDFVAAGGEEVRGFLRFPRSHFVTRLVRDADVIVNAASCRSHSDVVLSATIKNMFGVVLGGRRHRVHAMFPDARDFARVLVDIFRVARPAVSFLDMTTVREGHGTPLDPIQPVGLILGGVDPVAVDTVAAQAMGYGSLTVWTTVHAAQAGLGRSGMDDIRVRGLDWEGFEKKRLRNPVLPEAFEESRYDSMSRRLNNTILRPRPVIAHHTCTGCGDCSERCPADAIAPTPDGRYRIDHGACADCNCCVVLCDARAIQPTFVGLARMVRRLAGKPLSEPAAVRAG